MKVVNSCADRPSVGLVAGDVFSAHLLSRALMAAGAAVVNSYDDAAAAVVDIAGSVSPPDVVVVEARPGEVGHAETVALLSTLLTDAVLVAFAPTLDRDWRERLLAAGAAAVFERSRDADRLADEIAAMFDFWRRSRGVTGMALGA